MTKYLFITASLLLLQLEASAQHCKQLDSLRSFHGLKFGQNLKQSPAKTMPLLDNHTYYYEKSDKIKNDVFYEFLQFQNHSFDNIYIQCTKDDKIYSFLLKSYLGQIDSMYLEKNKMPSSFENLFDEIRSMFGDYTEEKIKADTIVGLTGSSYNYIWQCRKTKIECSIVIGSAVSIFNGITLTITDIDLERKAKIENIK